MKILSLRAAFVSVLGLSGIVCGASECQMMPMEMMSGHHHEMMMSTGTVHRMMTMMKSTEPVHGKKMKKNPVKGKSKKSAAEPAVTDFLVVPSAYGQMVNCPVTGEKIKLSKNTLAVKYKGKEYYFCCPACLKQFKENPGKYSAGE